MTPKRRKKEAKWQSKLPRPLAIQPEELEVLRPRKRPTVAEWALNRRVLSRKTSNYHGPWSHDYTPYAVKPMEKLSDVIVRQVTIMACAQSAKTEIGLNFLGWIIEEAPVPMGIFLPREDDTNRRVNTRIRSMFEDTPSLRKHLPGGRLENINIGKETVLDNMILYIGWAGSAASMADNPMGAAEVDELGKFPKRTGKEASPLNLIKDRLKTYPQSKLYVTSTPVKENDAIDIEFKDGDREDLWFKCPFCREYHLPKWFTCVKLDHGEDGHLLSAKEYEKGGHARYICPNCKRSWTKKDRWQAVTEGEWVPDGCTIGKNGRIIGKVPLTTHYSFRVHDMMLYPGFMTIDRMAALWARAIEAKKIGDIGPLQDFYNSHLARPFEEREKETEESVLVRHRGNYKAGTVPVGVQMITAGLDVQLDHIWYRLLGWGYMSEVWSIIEGRLETGDTSQLENYELVEKLLDARWPFVDDKEHTIGIYRAAIDCNYRTDVVFDFCRLHNDVLIPVRGDDTVRNRVFRATKIAGGALVRFDINTNAIKDRWFRLLYESAAPGPGYMHLHADTTDETFEQLASEEQRQIRRGRHVDKIWVKKDGYRANHLLDCDVYSIFAAEIAGARFLRDPGEAKPAAKKMQIERQGTRRIRTKY